MAVTVVDHDPRWPDLARDEIARLRATLPGVLDDVEHIGSTAVPELAAKPVIDLMAAVARLDTVVAYAQQLAREGYRPHETGMVERLFYRRTPPGPVVAYHLHVVTVESWPTRNERLLRDWLRAHPEDADAYGALKRRLATKYEDGESYTKAKTDFVQQVVDRARASRGLPPVSVWE